MKLGTRIFLCYIVIFILCFSYPVKWTLDNLRIRYLEGVEDSLVDQANILAAWLGRQMETGRYSSEELGVVFNSIKQRPLTARIYSVVKTNIDMHIYITDEKGRIVFDSEDSSRIGEDYRQWRDVRLTLEGKYGARSTRRTPANPTSSVLHVAAPIIVNGKIAGVLTIVKPTTMINSLLSYAKTDMIKMFGISALAAVILSFLLSLWMTRSIKRLTQYANDVRAGKKVSPPSLDHSEIGEMGAAFEKMRESLEGKKYVERYVETLTHEIKSPLSAIRGAAELLEENMEPQQRQRFLGNIRNEANRIQNLVDRLLELSSLENQKYLEKKEIIPFAEFIEVVCDSMEPLLSKKGISLRLQLPAGVTVVGDSFLLQRAVSNLLHNAIDFSPSGGCIELTGAVKEGFLFFTVCDEGPGVPDYATDKVFDKFFSLHRPDTGKKSTGLGLNFVREVAMLHKGSVTIENGTQKGACATLRIPSAPIPD
jgi:two-component system, OmpR family, sensor histidine kinase CreC